MGNVSKTLLFTMIVPGSVTILFPAWIVQTWPGMDYGPLRWMGIVPLVTGIGFYAWCAYDFAWTGRGTPAPMDPPKTLIVHGLYRGVRNPMYVGIMQILLGEVVLFGSLALAGYELIIFLMFNGFIFFYEEPILRKTFGPVYDSYRREVPRWIPDLTKWRTGK